jgi:WD40 repeat protein
MDLLEAPMESGPPLCYSTPVDGKTAKISWFHLVSDRTAQLWDTASGKLIATPLQHERVVRAVAFSPDGKAILTGSADKTARLWDTASGKPIGLPLQHEGVVQAVAFGPDGKAILTGSADRTARLWDVSTEKPIGSPLQHQDSVVAVAFSSDGKAVLTCSDTVRLWEVAELPDELPRIAAWVEVLTGLELDDRGLVHVLDNAAWLGRRERLEQFGGPPETRSGVR